MQTKTLKITLNTPAFLGDASQSGVWRTPPIKALLREWWRVARAPSFGYSHQKMREAEGLLFGNAWLEPDENRENRFCKSQVRIALEHWRTGKLKDWQAEQNKNSRGQPQEPQVPHPEWRAGSIRWQPTLPRLRPPFFRQGK